MLRAAVVQDTCTVTPPVIVSWVLTNPSESSQGNRSARAEVLMEIDRAPQAKVMCQAAWRFAMLKGIQDRGREQEVDRISMSADEFAYAMIMTDMMGPWTESADKTSSTRAQATALWIRFNWKAREEVGKTEEEATRDLIMRTVEWHLRDKHGQIRVAGGRRDSAETELQPGAHNGDWVQIMSWHITRGSCDRRQSWSTNSGYKSEA